jgi:folate-binding protein YgfZ
MGSVSSPASPLLSRPGAVPSPTGTGPDADPGTDLDAGLAWHYGDPLGEQRAADRGPVLLDRWTSGHLTVTGPDRLTWLHSLSSQHFEQFTDGDAAEALWLSPQGHVEHWADAAEVDGTVHLRTEPGDAPALLAFLESMRFWTKVDLADVTDEIAALTVAGKGADQAVSAALGATAPAGRATAIADGPAAGGLVRGHPDRVDLTVPRDRFAETVAALVNAGAAPAGTWAAAALRVAARRPRFGIDNDERTIPNEMPWLATAVHLQKGCYRGQETVARVDNLGQPPRRLVLLHLDGSADSLPVTGDAVLTDGGRKVGRVGTVTQHFTDGPIALALVKRSVGPDTPLQAGGVDAAMDPDDAVRAGRPFSVDRGEFHNFRRR